MREWTGFGDRLGYREEYILEDLRHEGLGDFQDVPHCPTCADSRPPGEARAPIYRCKECFGQLMECAHCCLERHQRLPLHVIQVKVFKTCLTSRLTCFCRSGTARFSRGLHSRT
jgi:hypothetical protein